MYFSPSLASACDYTFRLHSRSCRQPIVFLGKDVMEGSCAWEMHNGAAVLVRKVPERGNAPLFNLTPSYATRQVGPAIDDPNLHTSRSPSFQLTDLVAHLPCSVTSCSNGYLPIQDSYRNKCSLSGPCDDCSCYAHLCPEVQSPLPASG